MDFANTLPAFYLSLKVAFTATGINIILGITIGFLLARKRFPGRELLDTVLTLPMVLPPTVMGYYLLVLLGKRGVIGQWLESAPHFHMAGCRHCRRRRHVPAHRQTHARRIRRREPAA